MKELATHVHGAVSLARLGRDDAAIAALNEVLTSRSLVLDAPSRSYLEYVNAMAMAGADRDVFLSPMPTIGDDIDDKEIAVTVSSLLRWAESRWVSDGCLDRLRTECSRRGSPKAAQLAIALTARARNLARGGLMEAAAIACREGVALWRDQDLPWRADWRQAETLRLLGAIESLRGDHTAASAASAEACRLFRTLCEQRRERHLASWSSALHNLAGARLGEADVGGAVATTRISLALRRELAKIWPRLFQQDLTESLVETSRILNDAGLSEDGFALSAEAMMLAADLVDADPAGHAGLLMAALKMRARNALSLGYWSAGLEAADAELALHRSASTYRAQTGRLLAEALHNRATFLTMLDRDDEALASVEESLQFGGTPPQATNDVAGLRGSSLHLAGKLAVRVGDLEAARNWFTQAVDWWSALHPQTDPGVANNIAQSCIELANLYARLGNLEDAANATQTAVTALNSLAEREANTSNLTRLARGLLQLGNLRRKTGDLEAAIVAYRAAASLKRKLKDAGSNEILAVTAARKLIVCLRRAGRVEESEAWRQRLGLTE